MRKQVDQPGCDHRRTTHKLDVEFMWARGRLRHDLCAATPPGAWAGLYQHVPIAMFCDLDAE